MLRIEIPERPGVGPDTAPLHERADQTDVVRLLAQDLEGKVSAVGRYARSLVVVGSQEVEDRGQVGEVGLKVRTGGRFSANGSLRGQEGSSTHRDRNVVPPGDGLRLPGRHTGSRGVEDEAADTGEQRSSQSSNLKIKQDRISKRRTFQPRTPLEGPQHRGS